MHTDYSVKWVILDGGKKEEKMSEKKGGGENVELGGGNGVPKREVKVRL